METQTPRAPQIVFTLGVPVLGICYGMQAMVLELGGRSASAVVREGAERAENLLGIEALGLRRRRIRHGQGPSRDRPTRGHPPLRVGIGIDSAKPQVAVNGARAIYTLGETPSLSCTATDGGSGLNLMYGGSGDDIVADQHRDELRDQNERRPVWRGRRRPAGRRRHCLDTRRAGDRRSRRPSA